MQELHIRSMERGDLGVVAATERASFEFPWNVEDFVDALWGDDADCAALVAEVNDQVIGHLIYCIDRGLVTILGLCVMPEFRRSFLKVGSSLVAYVIDIQCSEHPRIRTEIRESNLSALLFFKAIGFWAVKLVREGYLAAEFVNDAEEHGYTPIDEDLVVMRYRGRGVAVGVGT